MFLRRLCVVALVAWGTSRLAFAGDEARPVPLSDLASGTYQAKPGGLYAAGANRPSAEQAAALAKATARIVPRDAGGRPDGAGKIGFVSVGASTGKQMMAGLVEAATAAAGLSPRLVLVNGNVGGQDVNKISEPEGRYWRNMAAALDAAEVTAEQVQAVWVQEDDLRDGGTDFPGRAERLRDKFGDLVRLLKQKFPHLSVCYFVDRHTTDVAARDGSSGNGAKAKHAEPRPYYVGWAVKWLIELQAGGQADLAWDGADARAPLVAWGPYLWTVGTEPRRDGYRWSSEMVAPDGVHLSEAGIRRMGSELLRFFSDDPYARSWFVGPQASEPAAVKPAAVKPVVAKPVVAETGAALALATEPPKNTEPKKPEPKNTEPKNTVPKPAAGKEAPKKEADAKEPETPAWIVNGKNKLPKLTRLVAPHEKVRVEAFDLAGKKLFERDDVLHRRTDLNAELKPGEFRLKFFAPDGREITLTQEVGEILLLK